MSKPTLLSPWFVVVRRGDGLTTPLFEWYKDGEDEGEQWTADESQARLFNSIHSAHRVARAGGGYAVLVADEEALKEFRPRGL
jgi:hypothetical protein